MVALLFSVFLFSIAANSFSATTQWWDLNFLYRFNIEVATGVNSPDKGYIDYTARIAVFDTATLIASGQMQNDCDDLRILFFNGTNYQELERHVIGCDSATSDIRFALSEDIAASSNDDNYYLYYGNASAGAPTALTTTNVYLWFDDATINRSASYTHGRLDAWHGTSWDDSLVHNVAGYYSYDTGDNFTSGYRRAVDERDVYIEAEFYHTGCYQLNQTTGVLTRGIIASGTGATEASNHYYASNRGQYPGCTTTGYTHDGDILKNQRTTTAVDGVNPSNVVANQWRRQGLASWLVNPTNLSFWDEDDSINWEALGYPSSSNLQVNGTDAAGGDHEARGFAAIMTAQVTARLRNILIRRYIEPEPVLTVTLDLQSDLTISKSDALTSYTPGGNATYLLTVNNSGPSPVTAAAIEDNLPSGVSLSAQWTCVSSAGSSCSAASGGSPGDQAVSLSANILTNGLITVSVPVVFSSDMADY